MEIKEAQRKLILLQEHIEIALINFSEETGLEVEYVNITNIHSFGKSTPSYQVRVDAKLLPQI